MMVSNRNVLFQGSIFRGELLVLGLVFFNDMDIPVEFIQPSYVGIIINQYKDPY